MNFKILFLLFVIFLQWGCEKTDIIKPAGFETVVEADTIVFAQIGDFGSAGEAERAVANMVKSWNPDFVVSVGDNNYYEGKFNTLALNITNYYGDFIYNYDAPEEFQCHGKAFEEKFNRFFPTPGNHDANNKEGLIPYYNYFTLPGIEKYYKFTWGPVTFYSVNTAEGPFEEEKKWLEQEIASSASAFNIVFLHHPPYSSGNHGSNLHFRWDFYRMGADIVFAGHDHIYERVEVDNEQGLYYIVNGVGGKAAEGCNTHPYPDGIQAICFGNDYGAVRGFATSDKLKIEFFSVHSSEVPIDQFELISNK